MKRKTLALCLVMALMLCVTLPTFAEWNPNTGVSAEFLASLEEQGSLRTGYKGNGKAPEHGMQQSSAVEPGRGGSVPGVEGAAAIPGATATDSQTPSVRITSITWDAENERYVVSYEYAYYGPDGGVLWGYSSWGETNSKIASGLKSGDRGVGNAFLSAGEISPKSSYEIEMRSSEEYGDGWWYLSSGLHALPQRESTGDPSAESGQSSVRITAFTKLADGNYSITLAYEYNGPCYGASGGALHYHDSTFVKLMGFQTPGTYDPLPGTRGLKPGDTGEITAIIAGYNISPEATHIVVWLENSWDEAHTVTDTWYFDQ